MQKNRIPTNLQESLFYWYFYYIFLSKKILASHFIYVSALALKTKTTTSLVIFQRIG